MLMQNINADYHAKYYCKMWCKRPEQIAMQNIDAETYYTNAETNMRLLQNLIQPEVK